MLLVSILITLLTLMGGILLLAKIKKQGLGKMYSGATYLAIGISMFLLTGHATRGIMQVTTPEESLPEHRMTGMMYGGCDRGGNMLMKHGWMNRGTQEDPAGDRKQYSELTSREKR